MHVLLWSAFDGVGACFYVSNTFQYILRSPFSFDRWWDTTFIKMDELRIWNLWVTVQCSEISDTTLFSWSPQNPSRYSLRSSPKKTQFAAAKISTFQPNSVNPSIWFIPISQDADGSRLLEKLKELCLGLRFSPRNHQRPGGIKRWDCSSAFEIQEMLVEQLNHPRNGKNAGKKHPKNGRDVVASYRLYDGNVVGLVTNHCSS